MYKKWFFIFGSVVVLIACVFSFVLSYVFNHEKPLSAAGSPNDPATASVLAISATPVPFAELVSPVTLQGVAVGPEAFLKDTPDNTDVTVSFREPVDFNKTGRIKVALTVELYERTADTTAELYILEPARVLDVEAGTPPGLIKPEDFIKNYDILNGDTRSDIKILTDLSMLDLMKLRRYEVEISFNGETFKSMMNMVDTAPPSAVAVNVTANTGQELAPEDFISDVFDVSPVTVRFMDDVEPDMLSEGEQTVHIALEDANGNHTTVTAMLLVNPNLSPPVFKGLRDLEVLLGDSVTYKKNVTAEDSFGNPVNFTVDSSEVDTYTPGEYTAIYTATDANGNETVKSVEVVVVEISEEIISEMLNKIMTKIISDDMTPREKAKKIFDWVGQNISYVSDAPKDSVYEGAYRALQYRSGDCFTFYALSEVLLTRSGIENMRVTRFGGSNSHYWNLVYIDDGWYHFDATPLNRQVASEINRFLFTDSDAERYTERIYEVTKSREYYTYEKELYPEVVQ